MINVCHLQLGRNVRQSWKVTHEIMLSFLSILVVIKSAKNVLRKNLPIFHHILKILNTWNYGLTQWLQGLKHTSTFVINILI